MNPNQFVITCSVLAMWTLALLMRDGFAWPATSKPTTKFTHVLPAVLQIVLFAYWAIYWRDVLDHMSVVIAQLAIAYAVDLLLAWTRRRPYGPSFGPMPIVFSLNLFVWFPPGYFLLSVLIILIALSSKALIVSAGRHVFNPSVLGMAIIGVLCVVLPRWFHYQDISHDFARPPYMAVVILLLALIPQIRLRTQPVAFVAALSRLASMLTFYCITGYKGGPSPWWPAWLLAITLLAGDPATIPTHAISRLLFGLFLGTTYYIVSRGLLLSVGTDFFSKVIPIPLANLLVPQFERTAARLSHRWPTLDRAVVHHACMTAWLSLSLTAAALAV